MRRRYILIVYIYLVLKTLQIKLLPDNDQRRALIDTFLQFNDACNFVSNIAWEKRLFNKILIQKIVYRDVREKFGLASQLAVRVIAKGEADLIASLNIRNRADVNQPIVTGAIFGHSILPVASQRL